MRRSPDRALADAVTAMNAAEVSLQDAADRFMRAGLELVAECAGESAARRWAWRHLARLAREGTNGPARFFRSAPAAEAILRTRDWRGLRLPRQGR